MHDLFNQLKEIVTSIPWHTVGTLLGAAGITSLLTQFAKKKLELVSKKVINVVLLASSFIPVAAQYVMTTASQNPSVLGAKALVVAGFASSVVYPFIISPIDKLLKDAQAERARHDGTGSTPAVPSVNVIEPTSEFQA